ncbi:MAG TPA: Holliday junction resolvase RuvX [Oscillatoriales cyanobacterium M59_W2019_021]|nr:MAG: Holliday junction resolvase RuvX [Cyanobacteria bacterium J055]HIK29792.1 Holliday junction resolvase RuvX [Oscillatoriales cyanobacterium M4454_W2019_049]HIK49832.1 Holliday junction resolvase RuvX [Oscillatoriales cyanobacterium M59_W2019_021]
MPRISALGLDIGRRRVGVAGCDGLGLVATGLCTLKRTSFDRDVAYLQDWVRERQVSVLVVGLPYTLDGTLGNQAKQVQKYAQRLSAALGLPVEYVDERLSSVEAEELMLAEGVSPSWNKETIDRKAAALILQRWLDERRELGNG